MSESTVRERPILFSAPMVRAILRDDDPKTLTRRVIKPVRGFERHNICEVGMPHSAYPWAVWWHGPDTDRVGVMQECPYGKPGDRLYVKEAWALAKQYDALKGADIYGLPEMGCLSYKADAPYPVDFGRPRHARFMPRWASRITLEITDVRVQRVQDISDDDARAEGIERRDGDLLYRDYSDSSRGPDWTVSPKRSFESLWCKINGSESWAANPWVWGISFRRIA